MPVAASPAVLPPLATPEQLAALVGSTADNPRVIGTLDLVSARFRGRAGAGWPITQHTATTNLDGHGRRSVKVRALALTACAVELVEHGTARALVDGTDFEWSEDGILDRLGGTWPDRRRCVRVTYTAGFDPVPEDVTAAVLEAAAAAYRITPGLASKQVGGITETYGSVEATGVTEKWSRAVAGYRIGGDRA